jgi:hypothetical protein
LVVSELSSMRGTIDRIRASEHGSTGVAVLSAVGVTLAAIVIGLVVGMAVAPEGFGDDWEAVAAERGITGGSGASDGSAGDDPAAGEPMRYGDDPELDALWDACEDGDWDACDDLYWSTPIDSRYEEFGATCGDRVEFGMGDCATRAG